MKGRGVKILFALTGILWMHPAWVIGQELEQNPQSMSIQEAQDFTMSCNSSSTWNSLAWYRQESGKQPVLLMILLKGKEIKSQGKFTAQFGEQRKNSFLLIKTSQPQDSGTYFCAGDTSYNNLQFGSGTQLMVRPIIKDPEPALYQLRSPKSSDLSVCLFTDFDSNQSIKDANTNASDPTVLEMMTMESKSYGAVAWGDKSNMDCTKAFQQNMVNFTQVSGSTCKVKDVKQGFETDKDLNTMNMILIVVRITFLKAVGFNLLMTLRLWSN